MTPPGSFGRLSRFRGRSVATEVSESPHRALGLTDDDLLRMYRFMVTARLLDEAQFRLNRQGKAAFVIPVSGHEACQMGTAWALQPGKDIWVPYYRDLALVLVAGMTPLDVMLGVFAKRDDPSSGGRQMPAHWGSRRLGIISGSSPIATQVPHAAGIAYAIRYRDEDAVVGCWFGDGATSEGDWHEGLNFAGVHKLPIVFVCENNHYAISVPQEKQMAVTQVASRAESYGFPGEVVDGNDVLAVRDVTATAVARARAGDGPTLLEAKSYRITAHSAATKTDLRPPEELDAWRARDPILSFSRYLNTEAGVAAERLEQIEEEARADVETAVEFALASPRPEPESALEDVYAPAKWATAGRLS
jgi:2-oxoisovalerate dehydrogenase E1 component alpha subunit